MLDMYLNWPSQIKDVIETWDKFRITESFNKIVVTGMGGSGVIGDYLQLVANSKDLYIPVAVSKSHRLPGLVDDETLVIVASYSGNTIETISAFREALRRQAKIVVLSSGGVLREEAMRNNLTHIPLPGDLLPRASLPVMLYRVLALLDSSGVSLVDKREALESYLFLKEKTDQSLKKAAEIGDLIYRGLSESRLLVLCTHTPLDPLAVRGKNEFNENSKIIAKVDVAPEWMHNDIVGYESPVPSRFTVLEIVDPNDKIGVSLVDFMRQIMLKNDSIMYRLELSGDTLLEKIMYGSLVLGLASVILAEKRGLNPSETKSIQLYKKNAKEIFGYT